MSGRRAEDQCLLEACSPRAERAAAVPETFWPGVLQDAAAHKLTNLALARWTQSVADAPPQIKSARRRAVVGNLAMAGSLVAVGIVAGVVPALRAVRVAPAEALRRP